MLQGPSIQLRELQTFVGKLEAQFLQPHLEEKELPIGQEEQLDSAAYAVLAHGALERFIESLATWVLDSVVTNWTTKKSSPVALACLLWSAQWPPDDSGTTFDRIRLALADHKQAMSSLIEANHGVSGWHLRKLFHRLGVNVPNDPLLNASLESMVARRHDWAHRYPFKATKLMTATDVKKEMTDCLQLAEKLAAAADLAVA